MALTTFPEQTFPAAAVLEGYRFRWQIELVFKRFKQIAQLGHVPKHDPESAQAWLYGKLLVALLTEKLIRQARAFPPGATNVPPGRRSPSPWREFAFVFRQVTRTILPRLSLRETMENWPRLAVALREPPRKRRSQEEKFKTS